MAPVPFGKSPLERMKAIKPEQHRHRKKDTKANNVGSVWQEDMNQGGGCWAASGSRSLNLGGDPKTQAVPGSRGGG